MSGKLLEFNDCGIYCRAGNFYIDPWKPVDHALITHAHSDHARWGMKHYLAHELSEEIMRYRLGQDISLQTLPYNQPLLINGVRISLHPAGHIPGSAQIRVEHKGEVWVVSGDYKLEPDGVSDPFEPVRCHSFISECTFGLPVYQWEPQADIFREINKWWRQNADEGLATVIAAYSLGKVQRILQNIDESIGPIYTHGVVANSNEALVRNGIPLKKTLRVSADVPKEAYRRALILCPPSALGSPWMRRFQPYRFGYCSGWMAIRGAKRRRAADRGFALSDHADWKDLNKAIAATDCETVYLTHGYTAAYSRYLADMGYDAHEAKTLYGGDEANELDDPAVDLADDQADLPLAPGKEDA